MKLWIATWPSRDDLDTITHPKLISRGKNGSTRWFQALLCAHLLPHQTQTTKENSGHKLLYVSSFLFYSFHSWWGLCQLGSWGSQNGEFALKREKGYLFKEKKKRVKSEECEREAEGTTDRKRWAHRAAGQRNFGGELRGKRAQGRCGEASRSGGYREWEERLLKVLGRMTNVGYSLKFHKRYL